MRSLKLVAAVLITILQMNGGSQVQGQNKNEAAKSQIKSVTVYRNQARVIREIKVPAANELQTIRIASLPQQIIQATAFTESDPKTKVRSLQIQLPELLADGDRVAAQEKIDTLQAKLKVAEQDLSVIEQDMLTLQKLVDYSSGKIQQNLDRATLDVQSVTALADFTMDRRRKLAKELFTKQAEIDDLNKQIKEQHTALTSKRIPARKFDAVISALSPAGGWIRLSYDVAGASWTPRYKIQATNVDAEKPTFDIHLGADIKQNTGETWENVSLTLATSTPRTNASRPLLTPLRINAVEGNQNPNARAVGQFGRGAQDSVSDSQWLNPNYLAHNVDLNTDAGRRQIDELTSTIEVQRQIAADASVHSTEETYKVGDQVSLNSGPATQTVAILDKQIEGEFYRVVTPLLSSFAFREASIINVTGQNLIAGPADVYLQEQFVGRIQIPPTASGQKVIVGFGSDRQVRTRRELLSRADSIKGGNKQSTLKYRLVVSNFHKSPIAIRLLDRIPIAAMDESINLSLSAAENERLSADALYQRMQRPTGILRWDLEIPAKRFGSDAYDHEYEYAIELDRQQSIVGDALVQRTQQDLRFNKTNGGGGFGGGGAMRIPPSK